MMKNQVRIGLIVFVLIGGTTSFGFWAHQQLGSAFKSIDGAFGNLSASYVAVSMRARDLSDVAMGSTSTTQAITEGTASSTIPFDFAFSSQDGIDPKFELVFSPKKDGVYIGCTYEIAWVASTTIRSLRMALIDAGTREASGPIASGLAREYEIQPGTQSLHWKVGVVWPGEYFISLSKINGIEKEATSNYFTIREAPKGISANERENICKESGGVPTR